MSLGTLHEKLSGMISGYCTSQAIHAAARLGIADLLSEGPRTVEDLATETSTDSDSLFRLLRALASIGIFTEESSRCFALTPLAELLQSDHDNTLRPVSLMMGDDHYRTWGSLLESLRTGNTVYEEVMGAPIFEYMSHHPEKAQIFDEAMMALNRRKTSAILDAYDFSGIDVLADIGGGNGSNLIAILTKYPSMSGILYDLPHVVERARPNLESAGLTGRCQLLAGDFFQSVPTGADAYLMRHIIHDWNDEQSLTILRHCRDVIPANGRLLVVEGVVPNDNTRSGIKMLDLTMMLIPGGKERTEAEYHALFRDAGFNLSRVVPSRLEIDVIEGQPAED